MAYNRISRYETFVRAPNADKSDCVVRYHQTDIVTTFERYGRVLCRLDHNYWKGVTTKRKMNQASHEFGLGYGVHQRKHVWYVTTKAGEFEFDERAFTFDMATGLPFETIAPFMHREKAA